MTIWQGIGWFFFGTTVGKFLLFGLLMVLPMAAVLTWMERRQSAYSQDRYGPSRAHFFSIGGKPFTLFGLIHIVADSIKMFFKEMTIPKNADRALFKIAPLFGFVTAMLIIGFVPFGPDLATEIGNMELQMIRLDAGILWIFAVGSLGIYGAALAGWASNNRFALLGSLRASAQAVSYEVALGLTVVGTMIAYGTTELSQMVDAQSGLTFHGALPNWGLFIQPVGAMLFLIAAMAENKRAPFDLPEGESEIIGYFLEYSSMGFGLFMLGEFIEVVVLSTLFVTLFLGGWQLPWIMGDSSIYLGFVTITNPWLYGLFGFIVFALKTFLVCAFQLQVRWTLPRFRYDQLMRLGWKNLLPWALANIFVTAGLVWLDPTLDVLTLVGVVLIGLFVMVVVAGPRRAAPLSVPGH